MSKFYCSLGLMSGTSADGVDASIIQSDGDNKYELILLEHNYLTSPEKLFEYQKKYFDDELTMIEIENISSIKFEKKKLVINKFIQKKIHETKEQ